MRQVLQERTWALVGLGAAAAVTAGLLEQPEVAAGILTGTPVGVANHWMTRLAAGRWRVGAPKSAGWVIAASYGRLLVAGGLLWWAAGRGPAFLVGVLGGLLVEMADYMLRLRALLRRRGRGS